MSRGIQPTAASDDRDFSDPIYRETTPPPLSLLRPPPIGTTLPLTPLSVEELQAALALPEDQSRTALLRCLDYFGATRLEQPAGGANGASVGGAGIDVGGVGGEAGSATL
eukprot:544412-Prymnesium_polylepis.1